MASIAMKGICSLLSEVKGPFRTPQCPRFDATASHVLLLLLPHAASHLHAIAQSSPQVPPYSST